ncbi:helix-turn-helix transcriptional regulator [Nonomuraea sediminis]|uniref:helix-turn-helix transcriptional regulator n=1 Tax=Nonomuraea sediminis TaxID=2835864 RepID=UPI002029F4F6|nr:helix-turn-helix transcriptional regulator [Nonomuraea sediminis]
MSVFTGDIEEMRHHGSQISYRHPGHGGQRFGLWWSADHDALIIHVPSTLVERALAVLSRASPGERQPSAASPIAAARHFEQFLEYTLLGEPGIPAALRRARLYCEEHAGEYVSLRDIAAAARVSVRTLQHDFRKHLRTTPMAYLREVRLARAHADLVRIAETGARTTVTEVAMRWGFSHLGRFSSLYRRTYGRPPSSTLSGRR